MIQRVLPYFLLVCFLLVGAAIVFPTGCRSRESARRASCQSNLKQIGISLQQYAQDYGDHLPPRYWAASLVAYAKTEALFQCPETTATIKTTDYFFNAHFLKGRMDDIRECEDLSTLIFLGEGTNDGPLDMAFSRLPDAWRKDEKSSLWRHLGGANYGFGDGHVKWMKASTVGRDLRRGKA